MERSRHRDEADWQGARQIKRKKEREDLTDN